MEAEVKTYTLRDSATAALRKIGVKSCDYNLFINKLKTGIFEVALGAAKAHLESLNDGPTSPLLKHPIAGVLPAETEIAPRKKGERCESVSSLARKLILDGLDNEAVFKGLKKKFQLPEDKKSYPGWYRNDMKRKGLLK